MLGGFFDLPIFFPPTKTFNKLENFGGGGRAMFCSTLTFRHCGKAGKEFQNTLFRR